MVLADEMARWKESLANAKHIEPQAFEQDDRVDKVDRVDGVDGVEKYVDWIHRVHYVHPVIQSPLTKRAK
jgi:hypothetical protein